VTLVAFVSGRSPGLTTGLHALAATWPRSGGAVLAELDPDGGSLALRHEIPAEPGLTTLAAAGRRGLAPGVVAHHCQRLCDGTPVLLGPSAPDRAASALSVLGPRLAFALDAVPGMDVLADCGRISSRSAALDVVLAARYVVLVVAPTVEGVAQAQARLATIELPSDRLAVITVGVRPYDPREVGSALGVPAIGSLASDHRAASELIAGRPPRRSELWRSATALSTQLAARLLPLPQSSPTPLDIASPPMPVPSADPVSGSGR
jgi:hypothetical protein